MGNPQQADLAYAAGFFDGEGSLHTAVYMKNGRVHQKHFKATITSTCLPTLNWFKDVFGGSIHASGGYGTQLGKKQCWNWAASGENAYAFIKTIEPFLKEKREHAMFVATTWELRQDTQVFIKRCEERKHRWGRAAAETK